MTIDEAIEYLTIVNLQLDKFLFGIAIGKKRVATQLGIEALKRVKQNRAGWRVFEGQCYVSVVYKLLPGETEK